MKKLLTSRRRWLRLSGVAFATSLPGCSDRFGGSDSDIKDTDGDGVINTEDYAPWDDEIQAKSQFERSETQQPPTSTDPESTTQTTESPEPIAYSFEDGLEGWVPVWAGPNDCPDQPGLQHETGANRIEGSGSALFTTECDSNLVAGPTFDINPARDFTVSVDFYFEDEDSRGLFIHLYGSDRNGSANDRIRVGDDSHRLVRARRRPANDHQSVSAVGQETQVQVGTIDPGTRHRLVGRKRGETITATLDGETVTRAPAADATWNPSETYRMMLVHSGAWGAPSRIWFDSISISHGSV